MKTRNNKAFLFTLGAVVASACSGDLDDAMPVDLDAPEEEWTQEGAIEEEEDSSASSVGSADGVDEPASELDYEYERYEDDELVSAESEQEGGASDDAELLGEAPETGPVDKGLFGSCGSTSTLANSVYNYVAVPDHFPPDSAAAQLAAVALGLPLNVSLGCLPFGRAHMHDTCDFHDGCYATPGKSKAECDGEAKDRWQRTCRNTYDDIGAGDVILGILTGGVSAPVSIAEQACRSACLAQAEAMYGAIRAFGQSAYENAQLDASRPTIDPNQVGGPIFF